MTAPPPVARALAHALGNPLAAMLGLATLAARRALHEPALAPELAALVDDVHRMAADVARVLDAQTADASDGEALTRTIAATLAVPLGRARLGLTRLLARSSGVDAERLEVLAREADRLARLLLPNAAHDRMLAAPFDEEPR